ATNYPNFKSFERQRGRVPVLPPGGRWETSWSIEVHETSSGVAAALQEIVKLQAHAKALLHRTPQSRFCALETAGSTLVHKPEASARGHEFTPRLRVGLVLPNRAA